MPRTPPNAAEEFTFELCRRSFLSLWSYRNPRQSPGGNELCDVLVVCEPDVIIFSVKEIQLKDTARPETDARRWLRKAVEESSAQIYGAESTIMKSAKVIRHDNSFGLPFPKPAHLYRIGAALGSKDKVRLPYGDFGKGFVHVFDERSTMVLFSELNTITDFVAYLREKEQFHSSGTTTHFEGREEDLLALYVHGGRKFPSGYDRLIVGDDLWDQVQAKPEYRRRIIADAPSYLWDGIIESFCRDALNDNLEFGPGLTDTERAIRVMAREHRFARRILGKSLKEFLDASHRVRSRMTISPSGVLYVFLATPHGTERKHRVAELGNRCFVARGLNRNVTTVVGVATEQYEKDRGFSLDLIHLYQPVWTPKYQTHMEEIQRDLGYFVSPQSTRSSEDEYPP